MLIDRLPLQAVVFFLVAAAFSTVYITQPVLPVLAEEFGADPARVSLTVSAVVLGIALSILPIGILTDRSSVQRILLAGGSVVVVCSLLAALTEHLWTLITVRFVQGLFVPMLTTSLVAYLARTLPPERLNVVMGSYVSATVTGGLGGRLLGGWLHPPAHWRYAFVTAAVLVGVATVLAVWRLRGDRPISHPAASGAGLWSLVVRIDLLRLFGVAFASFFAFSSVFNFLPFHLSEPPLAVPVQWVTALYLTYVLGILVGPLAGGISNRHGNGAAMSGGAAVFALGLMLSLLPSVPAVAVALAAVCTGYFAVHASAVGALNQRLETGRGRANALYVLFYYVGGWSGITASGYAYEHQGWRGVVVLCLVMMLVPLTLGLYELRRVPRTRP
ncbi:MFS transporter [Elongatibacter sediminis]|uniref:MFS transporter n=1 Tax=Elongatibacter sediminis TaxID=3119006 RepID=A0AAW9R9K8_9GAMM